MHVHVNKYFSVCIHNHVKEKKNVCALTSMCVCAYMRMHACVCAIIVTAVISIIIQKKMKKHT